MRNISINNSFLLSFLKKLVAIESINPSLASEGGGEEEIANFIGAHLEKRGFTIDYQMIDKKRMNVIGVLHGTGSGKTLMLNGHTDTVGTSDMKIDALKPTLKDGKVYGRGSYDMKGGLAAMVAAGEVFASSKQKMRGDLILAFVADEEYASRGTEELIKKYTADAAIVTEPTELQVVTAHRGFAWARICIEGVPVHGSLYEYGIDAIVKAGKVLVGLENMESGFAQLVQHSLLGRPSIHASLINGGTELSTYPSKCEIQLERRTLPHEQLEEIKLELDNLLYDINSMDPDFLATSEVFFYRPGLDTEQNSPIVKEIIHSCLEVRGVKPKLIGALWWTDAALLSAAGIPSILFGPSGEGGHAPVEYVDFDSLIQTTKILATTIMNYCK
ncbi:ArgE/DapE family deacylase [Candidatus Thorarchaeota archaeon]|nr:MAG: ArgE/DapE family deacylase [Candidatus Thorarchaeota archaeon]